MYSLYDEQDRLLAQERSPVAAELRKTELERTLGITVYVVRD